MKMQTGKWYRWGNQGDAILYRGNGNQVVMIYNNQAVVVSEESVVSPETLREVPPPLIVSMEDTKNEPVV